MQVRQDRSNESTEVLRPCESSVSEDRRLQWATRDNTELASVWEWQITDLSRSALFLTDLSDITDFTDSIECFACRAFNSFFSLTQATQYSALVHNN